MGPRGPREAPRIGAPRLGGRDLARSEREPVLPRPSFDLTAIGVDAASVGAEAESLEVVSGPPQREPGLRDAELRPTLMYRE